MIKLGWQFIFNILHNNGNRWGNLSIKYMAFSSLQNEQNGICFCEHEQSGNAIFVPSINICAYTYIVTNTFLD